MSAPKTVLAEDEHGWSVASGLLRLRVRRDHVRVALAGIEYARLAVGCSVQRPDGRVDRDDGCVAVQLRRGRDGGPVFVWRTRSTLWDRKEYRLEVAGGAMAFRVIVHGRGRIERVSYFTGAGAPSDWGSEYQFARYFLPCPRGGEQSLPQYLSPATNSRVELGYLAPPLLAVAATCDEGRWLAMGLAPRPGRYNIDHFDYCYNVASGGRPRMYLATDYLGYTQVEGSCELAAVVATPGRDEYDALAAHASWLYDRGGCRRRDWSESPRWWHGPLFCGWGEQCFVRPDNPQAAASQEQYQRMSDRLDAASLRPTAIIVDDQWMSRWGEALPDARKWPDMRRFVDAQHAKGRRVMVWLKAWNTDGLEVAECINRWGQPCGTDPASPAYRRRVQRLMERLLGRSEGCYDLDGFKVDFANVMPLGPNLRGAGGAYGIELLKQYFELLHASAKAVKADCLINCSCGHPYFAEVTDQCRLHDYYWGLRCAWEVMSYRQRLFQAAMPGVLIDTDGVVSTHRETMDYARRCVELGVPALYTLSGGPDVRLTARDLRQIREVWDSYIQRVSRGRGRAASPKKGRR